MYTKNTCVQNTKSCSYFVILSEKLISYWSVEPIEETIGKEEPEKTEEPPKAVDDGSGQWSDITGGNEVVHLTDTTFDGFIKENPSVLVMFYAPCK